MKKKWVKAEPCRLFTIQELIEMRDDPNQWIVPHMIPRAGRVLAYGKGGVYKSSIIFDLCVAVASGGKLLEQLDIHTFGPVILISVEGNIYTNRERLVRIMRSRNIHPQAVNLHYGQNRFPIDTEEGLSYIEKQIAELHPVLVVLDPFIKFMSGDENNATDADAFTAAIDYLITKYETTFVVIHHANKIGDVRGSSVIHGWADSVLSFSKEVDVHLPGISYGVNLLTIEGQKQRNGQEGKLISAVPFIDETLGTFTFGIYNNLDADGVISAHLKQEITKFLISMANGDPEAAVTKTELAHIYHVGTERVSAALEWLKRNSIATDSVSVRSTSKDGSRARNVTGWHLSPEARQLDEAILLIRAANQNQSNLPE